MDRFTSGENPGSRGAPPTTQQQQLHPWRPGRRRRGLEGEGSRTAALRGHLKLDPHFHLVGYKTTTAGSPTSSARVPKNLAFTTHQGAFGGCALRKLHDFRKKKFCDRTELLSDQFRRECDIGFLKEHGCGAPC